MRLVHVLDRVAAIGGVQTYLEGLLPALSAQDVQSSIVVGVGDTGSFAGAEIRVASAVLADGAVLERGERRQLREALAALSPDAVYVHVALSPAIMREVSTVVAPVVYAHDYFMTCPGNARFLQRRQSFCVEGLGARCFLRAYTERSMNRRPDRMLSAYRRARGWQAMLPELSPVLVASDFVARTLVDAGAQPDNVKVIPYPISPAAPSLRPASPFDVLFVGRLIAAKGADVLLEALARVKDALAVIAGDGPDRARLEELARRLRIADRIRFVGWTARDDRDALLAGARIVVLPSLWQEPFGIAGLEAFAAGVPVVASAVGGIPSWLRDGEAGLLVPPGEPDALGAALHRVLDDADLHARLAAQAPRVAERFSMERHLELLMPELRHAAL